MLDYDKIQQKINDYAVDTIYEIVEKYGKYLSKEQIMQFENIIIGNKAVIVDKNIELDSKFFNGNIPSAHGPRTKNDGFIHVYPYTIKNKNTSEIIEHYIKSGIIKHELFHYIIRLDFKDDNKELEEFSHYLNEGMVQLFTEMDNKIIDNNCEYRKNIALAQKLLQLLNGTLPFNKNLKELMNNDNLYYLFNEYLKIKDIENMIVTFLEQLNQYIKFDIPTIIRRLKRYSIDDSFKYLENEVMQLNDIEIKQKLLNELNNINKKDHSIIK